VREGTTLVYVSHDLTSVEAVCDQALWLADAVVQASGPTREVARLYRSSIQENASVNTPNEGIVQLQDASITGPDGGPVMTLEDAEVRVTLKSPEATQADFFVGVSLGEAFPIFITKHHGSFPSGEFEVKCRLENLPLPKGHYSVWTAMSRTAGMYDDYGTDLPLLPWKPAVSFDIFGAEILEPPPGVMVASRLHVGSSWVVE
jgi:hypothetical protein